MEAIQVQGAPGYYQCYPGVVNQLPVKMEENQLRHGLIIHGGKSWEAAKEYIPSLPAKITYEKYNGECTHEEVNRINDLITGDTVDVVIGIGGGKIADITKACGNATNLPVILIPTLASNCAPWTALSVFYDEAGNFLEYEAFPRSTFMLLVDPDIIVHSPTPYLRAGIGDTIAKWYEADVLMRALPAKSIPLEVSLHAARLCRDVLLENGAEAITSMEQADISDAFTKVIETIIMAGGMVGGYGDQYGRISGAHSIHNGLTHVPETHPFLHGDKVAYGILVQLSLEQRPEEMKKLLPFYNKLQLPVSLQDLGIKENIEAAVNKIAERATKPSESIHFMGVSSADEVKEGIWKLEGTRNLSLCPRIPLSP